MAVHVRPEAGCCTTVFARLGVLSSKTKNEKREKSAAPAVSDEVSPRSSVKRQAARMSSSLSQRQCLSGSKARLCLTDARTVIFAPFHKLARRAGVVMGDEGGVSCKVASAAADDAKAAREGQPRFQMLTRAEEYINTATPLFHRHEP
jgi:hypothetical protein